MSETEKYIPHRVFLVLNRQGSMSGAFYTEEVAEQRRVAMDALDDSLGPYRVVPYIPEGSSA